MNLEQIRYAIENGKPEEILTITFLNKVRQAILNAERDGGAVGDADVMVCQIGDYAELDKRAWATVIYDDKKVAECYTNEDAELVGAALRVYSTHSARSGVVSDEDVEAVKEFLDKWPYINCVCGRTHQRMSQEMRAALEHFAKGERHE